MDTLSRLTRRYFAFAFLILVTAILFGILLRHIIFNQAGDYGGHITFAYLLLEGQILRIHALYQVLIIGIVSVFNAGWKPAGWIVAFAMYIVIAAILYALFRRHTQRRALAVIGALALMIVEPITLLTWGRSHLYFAYISINAVHNPTMIMLKPFALVGFATVVGALTGTIRFNPRNVAICAALIALSMFAKPSFALTLLPALIVVLAYRWMRREFTGMRLVIAGFVIPLIILLPLQYVLQYLLIPALEGSGSYLRRSPRCICMNNRCGG